MDQSADQEVILASLRKLEARIAAIEAHLGVTPEEIALEASAGRPASSPQSEEAIEMQIGENWFAKMGILVLALGMVFLLTFPYRNLPPALSFPGRIPYCRRASSGLRHGGVNRTPTYPDTWWGAALLFSSSPHSACRSLLRLRR